MIQNQRIPQVQTLRPRTVWGARHRLALCLWPISVLPKSRGALSPHAGAPGGPRLAEVFSPVPGHRELLPLPSVSAMRSCLDKGVSSSGKNTISFCLWKLRYSLSPSFLAPLAFLTDAVTEGPRFRLQPWSPCLTRVEMCQHLPLLPKYMLKS